MEDNRVRFQASQHWKQERVTLRGKTTLDKGFSRGHYILNKMNGIRRLWESRRHLSLVGFTFQIPFQRGIMILWPTTDPNQLRILSLPSQSTQFVP